MSGGNVHNSNGVFAFSTIYIACEIGLRYARVIRLSLLPEYYFVYFEDTTTADYFIKCWREVPDYVNGNLINAIILY